VRPFRLIVTGGGTGGHTYPAIAAVRTLQARLGVAGRALEVLWVGTADSLEARVAAAEGIRFAAVATSKIRRSSNPAFVPYVTSHTPRAQAARLIRAGTYRYGGYRPRSVRTPA
jgi:UDP-N-acetylglucosamine:LPS N-acetylglucosamine transferase